MPASLRRSASASAAMPTNSLPRWLISITDMPASCQLTSSHLAFSSTSTGMVAGPAPKLKMRAAGLICDVVSRGRGLDDIPFRVGAPAVPVSVPVPVFAIFFVTIEDALEAGELLALVEVDERHALGGAAHLADLGDPRADEHAARRDEHDLVLGGHEGRGHDLAVALGRL